MSAMSETPEDMPDGVVEVQLDATKGWAAG
jgi:hypothetical protein